VGNLLVAMQRERCSSVNAASAWAGRSLAPNSRITCYGQKLAGNGIGIVVYTERVYAFRFVCSENMLTG